METLVIVSVGSGGAIKLEQELRNILIPSVAKSGKPSPLKSATAKDSCGPPPRKFFGAFNPPEPLFNKTEIAAESTCAVATSNKPSPLKSPATGLLGPWPTLMNVGPANTPAPFPGIKANVSRTWLAITRSTLPSPVKSPIVATELQPVLLLRV